MKAWFNCPATLNYNQEYLCTKPQEFNFGSRVHELMEKGEEPVDDDQGSVKGLHAKIKELERYIKITPIARELKQTFEILPGIQFTRIIDLFGAIGDKLIAVDYKTAYLTDKVNWGVVYKEDKPVSPQSMTFQAVGYLIHPPDDAILWKDIPETYHGQWPSSIVFLVAPMRGGSKVFEYSKDAAEEKNFYDALKFIYTSWKKGINVYNRGKSCAYCPWMEMCYKSAGYESLYIKRDRQKEHDKKLEEFENDE